MKRKLKSILLAALLCLVGVGQSRTFAATRVTFPYTPIGVASWPWWIAKDAGYFAKHGLDVDAVYAGASPVIVQAMLGGQAGVGAGGRPARSRASASRHEWTGALNEFELWRPGAPSDQIDTRPRALLCEGSPDAEENP